MNENRELVEDMRKIKAFSSQMSEEIQAKADTKIKDLQQEYNALLEKYKAL